MPTTHQRLELIGYIASVLVALSLTMRSVVRLRAINLAGAVTFCIYGLLIGAYPVAAVNLFIVGVNLFYLRQMLAAREYFTLLPVETDSQYLRYFLQFHEREILRFLPQFSYEPKESWITVFLLRDLVPAGLFIGERRDHGMLLVHLDFAIAAYRDLKLGRYLFGERSAYFRSHGIDTIVSPAGTPAHAAYLRRIGFSAIEAGDQRGMYRLPVTG